MGNRNSLWMRRQHGLSMWNFTVCIKVREGGGEGGEGYVILELS